LLDGLDDETLSEVMGAVSDGTGHRGSYNFRIVEGAGEDDSMWEREIPAPVPTFIPVHDGEAGPNWIRTFALIRELRGLGLKETKAIIENLPAVLVEGVSREVADSWWRRFEAAGAIADIKPSWE
jgi:ribosomal protein L7/L12